jgi:hypothetical protein
VLRFHALTRTSLRFKWVQYLNHATAQMNHKVAHQAAFHPHSIGAPQEGEKGFAVGCICS